MSDTKPSPGAALLARWDRADRSLAYQLDRDAMAIEIDAAILQAQREGAEAMRKVLVQAFLEHAGEVGTKIEQRALWLERAEATKRLRGMPWTALPESVDKPADQQGRAVDKSTDSQGDAS